MMLRPALGATVVAFAFGSISVGPAYAQRRDGSLLPQEQSGTVTAVGCLVKGTSVRGGKDDYVLARPRRGPIASVPEASCSTEAGADALQLDNAEKANLGAAMVGKWVQISGRLERETSKDPDDLRELDVETAKLVPVVVPRQAAASPAPAAAPAPRPYSPPPVSAAPAETAPEPARSLPKTASQVPAVGLAGFLLIGVGLALRTFRLRQQG